MDSKAMYLIFELKGMIGAMTDSEEIPYILQEKIDNLVDYLMENSKTSVA